METLYRTYYSRQFFYDETEKARMIDTQDPVVHIVHIEAIRTGLENRKTKQINMPDVKNYKKTFLKIIFINF